VLSAGIFDIDRNGSRDCAASSVEEIENTIVPHRFEDIALGASKKVIDDEVFYSPSATDMNALMSRSHGLYPFLCPFSGPRSICDRTIRTPVSHFPDGVLNDVTGTVIWNGTIQGL
jgi:hypothetical protein